MRLILKDFLPYKLSVVSNQISSAIAQSYGAKFDLSLPEWRVMAILGECPDISARQVALKTAMDKVAVSRAVNKLLEAGRLERHFAKDDKRRSVLALSPEGQKIYDEICPIALTYEEQLLNSLSQDEIDSFNTIISKLDEISKQSL